MLIQTMKHPEDFDSLIGLVTYFDNEDKCIQYFQQRRWKGNVICAHCGHDKVYKFSDNRRFKCASCKKQFNVRTGTIFEESKLSLRKWVIAMYLVTSHKKGISSYQLARDIKVTQKTAWFLIHRIRHQLGKDNNPTEQLKGIVEADETFVGGKNKNRHKVKKVEQSQGRSFKDKTPILGLMQRAEVAYIDRPHKVIKGLTVTEKITISPSVVKTIVIPNTRGEIIRPIVRKFVQEGSYFISDEWHAYRGLNVHYKHDIVNHGIGQYAIGEIHSNTIEGFWTWIKRMITGVYHYVSPKHLQNYAHEVTFRHNTRDVRQSERFEMILSRPIGYLSYKSLIRKYA